MDELFYVGNVDNRYDETCHGLQIAMYVLILFVASVLVVQAVASYAYLARKTRNFTPSDASSHVMVMVPCYNEGKAVLKKTINSVLESDYNEHNKVLTVVTDGIIKGGGETESTPQLLSELLGFQLDPQDHAYEYTSLGEKTTNFASVYYGIYSAESQGKTRSLKYIVVVKRGTPEEKSDTADETKTRPGNRGKRDSQIILQGMFNRFAHQREPCPLDEAIAQALGHLGFTPSSIKFLMCIDADTRVATDAIQHMVFSMEEDDTLLACCGETQVENKAQSLTTMIQVFEYYSSHHFKKAFESAFGCVTCLPGCFTMYRLQTSKFNTNVLYICCCVILCVLTTRHH